MTKVTVDKVLLEQLLDALDGAEQMRPEKPTAWEVELTADDVDAISAALTAALVEPVLEPVGYIPALEISRLRSGHDANLRSARFGPSPLDGDIAVYLSPPPPAKVPMLTDEEIRSLIPDEDGWKYGVGFGEATDFARAIEAAVRNRGVQK